MGNQRSADRLRGRIGAAIFERVAGPQGPTRRRRIAQTGGERWFAEDRPVRQVQGDSSMFVGGISALLLQSLHPLAMAAVAQHSDYRGDPWGRLQRTSYFLAVTTFGQAADAEEAIARVKAVHRHVTGTAPDGRPYAASDPHLLTWVHIAEADSFLRAHTRFGAHPLDQAGRDGYVADMAQIGLKLGVPDPPRTEAELAERIGQYRAELTATAEARDAARFLLVNPPLPAIVRAPYGVLAAAAVSLLPGWARRPLHLPRLPVTEAVVVRPAGRAMVQAIRWATSAPPADSETPEVPEVPARLDVRRERAGPVRGSRHLSPRPNEEWLTTMDAASPEKPMLTVALDVPSAYILADQAAIIQDLQFVMDGCKRLLAELAKPEEERDQLLPLAIWTSAVVAYTRCFSKGKRFGLTTEDVQKLPLHGAVMKFHKWILEERNKMTAHSANPFEIAKVAAALTPAEQDKRRVEGIVIYATSHIVIDDVGVQQLGGLASELAKQTAEKAQEQQDVVLKDAQQLNIDNLYKLPPLRTWPPTPDADDDTQVDSDAGDKASA